MYFEQESSESRNIEGFADKKSELLRCALCKGRTWEPITLHCLHSLCNKCFKVKVKEQQKENCDNNKDVMLDCPSCNYQTYGSLKTDIKIYLAAPQAVKSLLDIAYGLDSPVCVSCKNRGKTTQSMFWCLDCIDHFCGECFDFHSSLPVLDKHNTCSLAEVKKDPGLVMKAREICAKHSLRFTKFCTEQECVCCDFCLSSDHIDDCKGAHKEIQHNKISELVNPKVGELQESLRKMIQDLDSKDKELTAVESNIEEFFKEEQMKADEKSQTMKKRLLESTDSLLAESYKISFYKIQEVESKITALKLKRSVLKNAVDLLTALQSGSDVSYFLEVKKIKQVIKHAENFCDNVEEGGMSKFLVSFEKPLETLSDVKCFGKITEIQPISNQTSPVGDNQNEYWAHIWSGLQPYYWYSESSESESSERDEDFCVNSNSTNLKSTCIGFGGNLFTPSLSIDIEDGFSHVTGCDWKSENEIVIVDQKIKGSPEIRVYDIHNGDLTWKVTLDQKPYGICVLPGNECVVTFPNEMKIQVYSLFDFSLRREVNVGIKCYGVFYWYNSRGGITMVAGEDKIIFYDKNFSETKCLTVEGEDIRYICAYNNNLIFYSDIKTNRVYSVLGNGNNRFEYTDDDQMIGAAGLIIDESKNVYVCEKGEDCIHVLNKSGDFIRKINVGRNPTAISLSGNETNLCIIRGGRHVNNIADIYTS